MIKKPDDDLEADMQRSGVSMPDLLSMTGASRATFFRWKKDGAPVYVRTILRQARRISALMRMLREGGISPQDEAEEPQDSAERHAGRSSS